MFRRRTMVKDDKLYPTIYYTSTGVKQANNIFGLTDNDIISHTQESNGEFKIVCKDTLTALPTNFMAMSMYVDSIRFENCENITSIGTFAFYSCTYLSICDLSGLMNVTSIGMSFFNTMWCNVLILPNNIFTKSITSMVNSLTSITPVTSLTLLGNEVHESLNKKLPEDAINQDLKIYVPNKLVDEYRERFPYLSDKIYHIT